MVYGAASLTSASLFSYLLSLCTHVCFPLFVPLQQSPILSPYHFFYYGGTRRKLPHTASSLDHQFPNLLVLGFTRKKFHFTTHSSLWVIMVNGQMCPHTKTAGGLTLNAHRLHCIVIFITNQNFVMTHCLVTTALRASWHMHCSIICKPPV